MANKPANFAIKKIVGFLLKKRIFNQSKKQAWPIGHFEMFPCAFVDSSNQGYRPPIVSPLKPEVKGCTKTNDKKYAYDLPALNFIHKPLPGLCLIFSLPAYCAY